MNNDNFKKGAYVFLFIILVFVLFANFMAYTGGNSTLLHKKASSDTIPELFSKYNLEDFYYTDNGYNINALSQHVLNPNKKIRSISVYRFSSAAQQFTLQDSILLNREGKPVVKMTPYNTRFSTTYFFYDDKGNGWLDITILENKYDTLYTLRRFNGNGNALVTIQYNITRKELNYISTITIAPVSDSIVNLKRITFEPDLNLKLVLPFDSRDMLIKQVNDSLITVGTKRIVYSDTSYNSAYKKRLRIENHALVDEKIYDRFTFNSDGDWIERKNEQFDIRRVFSYYAQDEEDYKANFSVSEPVLIYLDSQMDSLPMQAWENLAKKENSFAMRSELFESGEFGDSIRLEQAASVEEFLPVLWYPVSTSSGNITGIDSICYVVGYNTPIKNEDESNKRCLAIFEHQNGLYRLIKQSYGALENFYDSDNDLLFNGFDEINFNVAIEGGDIAVNYEYMRGEAIDEFSFEKGNWVLVRCSSGGRTCCQAETNSYDYGTKTYTYSVFTMGDENDTDPGDLPRDTTITIIQELPVIYMDSVKLKSIRFDENGIYLK
jgi:hypothetical protein